MDLGQLADRLETLVEIGRQEYKAMLDSHGGLKHEDYAEAYSLRCQVAFLERELRALAHQLRAR